MIFWEFVDHHPFLAILMLIIVCNCVADVVRSITEIFKEKNHDVDRIEQKEDGSL